MDDNVSLRSMATVSSRLTAVNLQAHTSMQDYKGKGPSVVFPPELFPDDPASVQEIISKRSHDIPKWLREMTESDIRMLNDAVEQMKGKQNGNLMYQTQPFVHFVKEYRELED